MQFRTLFCRMIMFRSCMISTAAKCSEVWGCGHGSLPAVHQSTGDMQA